MSKLENSLFEEFRILGIPTPLRQFVFHPKRKWRLDFAWPDRKIAVEVHGGIYGKKRWHHSFGSQQENDFEKINEAIRRGWSVFTFGPKWLYRSKTAEPYSKAAAFVHKIIVGSSVIPIVNFSRKRWNLTAPIAGRGRNSGC